MALNFTNNSDSANSLQFVSSIDFPIGSPIYYKQIESSKNYTIAGSSGNKTITITGVTGLTNATKSFFFVFSDTSLISDNYLSNTFTSGTIIINSVNTTVSSSGTVDFYDYDLAVQDSNLNIAPEFIVSKKISGTPNSYTAIKFGHINLPNSTWNFLKETSDGYSGLIGGTNYYLSSTVGKITKTANNYLLFKGLSRNRAFVNLNYSVFNWSDSSSAWKNSSNIDLASGKTYKINGTDVLSSTQVLGKTLPTGTVVGTNDSQNLTNKTINGFTYPTVDGSNGNQLVTNGSGTFNFVNINFITDINMSNAASGTIDLSSYSYQTSCFKITNPGSSMNFTNGTIGKWYTVVILSDGSYSFNSNCRFPIDNAQPIPSASGSVDVYSFFCIESNKFISTFAYGYNGVS